MSELNTYYIPTRSGNSCLCYLKSEADKVIADLEESHKMEVEQLLILNREQANVANRLRDSMEYAIRHQKFKRCLAMAKWCNSEAFYAEAVENDDKRADWLGVWTDKWEKLAEKFKEAK